MASFNRVFLMGNLTRDPELKYIPSGSAVATFSLAINRVYRLQTGEKKEETTFLRIVVWGKMGENCAQYLKKGSAAFVEGRVVARNWDAPDGSKRTTTEVIATAVQFLNSKTGVAVSEEGYGQSSAPSQSAPKKEPLEEISLDMPSEPPTGKGDGSDVVPF
ncbi:MAG: single-strand DNA-binding protein [Candidatus Omnitrophota bacterium]|jgi:single-strand DNA-binding protein